MASNSCCEYDAHGRQRRNSSQTVARRCSEQERDVTSILLQNTNSALSHLHPHTLPTLQLPHRLANHRRVERVEPQIHHFQARVRLHRVDNRLAAVEPNKIARNVELRKGRRASGGLANGTRGVRSEGVVAEDELLERLGGSDRLRESGQRLRRVDAHTGL